MDNHYLIYRHTSPSNKVYIGQTCDIKKRWGNNGNQYLLKNKNGEYNQKKFARAIKKYGWNNIKHEIILEGISKSEADYAEKYLIRWYKIHGLSYNITDGGEGFTGIERKLLLTYFDILEYCGKCSSYEEDGYVLHNNSGFKAACKKSIPNLSNIIIDNAVNALHKKGFLIKKYRGEYLLCSQYFHHRELLDRNKIIEMFTVEPEESAEE